MFKIKNSAKRALLVLSFCLVTYSSYAAGWRKVDDTIDYAYQDGVVVKNV